MLKCMYLNFVPYSVFFYNVQLMAIKSKGYCNKLYLKILAIRTVISTIH